MWDFAGRVAVVTGGAQGIGRAVVGMLLEGGATVAVADLQERVQPPPPPEQRDRLVSVVTDVTSEAQVEEMVRQVLERFGRVDVLVNNAGGAIGSRHIEEVTNDDWERCLALNLTSAFYCSRAVVPSMKAGGRASIVNVSSLAARSRPVFSSLAYTVAKAGLIGLTRGLSADLAGHGVRVNAVAPAFTVTGRGLQELLADPVGREGFLDRLPMHRPAQPDEPANVIAFLCSDASSYVTGVVLDVNGGYYVG